MLQGDPDGIAYAEYLMYVYGKSKEEASSIAKRRGGANRFLDFVGVEIPEDGYGFVWVAVSVSPLRYLQNLFGDEIKGKDVTLMEKYLLGLGMVAADAKKWRDDYHGVNAYLERLREAPDMDKLLDDYDATVVAYRKAFAALDDKIANIQKAHDQEIMFAEMQRENRGQEDHTMVAKDQ
ncbi:MAG: hypothetical protein IPP17_30350 [Bacteroidetes bacterium]|nr:hypothetical protein [Bacteroidota bacterium]